MPTSSQTLGKHLKQIRVSKGLSQEEVAGKLNVSRSTLAQMELGNRLVRAEDINRLAKIYGCSPASLMSATGTELSDPFPEQICDEIIGSSPSKKWKKKTTVQLRRAVAVSVALTDLEEKMGLRICSLNPPDYGLTPPSSQWEATHQGYVVAEQERLRLNLGDVPIRDVAETLAIAGIRTTGIEMPDDISSLFIQTEETGIMVIVNKTFSPEMRRFKYAHGFSHCLFDKQQRWIVCRPEDSDSFTELRASAFAGRFLLPETGLRHYLQSLGKDTMSQSTGSMLSMFTEDSSPKLKKKKQLSVDGRDRRGMNPLSVCDLTQIAHYFGVDLTLTAHILANLRYLDKRELDRMVRLNINGTTGKTLEALALRKSETNHGRDAFHSRLLALSLEGLAREIIDMDYFDNVAVLVGVTDSARQILLAEIQRKA